MIPKFLLKFVIRIYNGPDSGNKFRFFGFLFLSASRAQVTFFIRRRLKVNFKRPKLGLDLSENVLKVILLGKLRKVSVKAGVHVST